jgi:hypothetical protein
MRWSRAAYHLQELALGCADMATRPASIFPLRVSALWTYGQVLTSRDDLDYLQVVLAVDLPAQDVAWLCAPVGAEHWSHAAGLSKKPVVVRWRSMRAPLWNHQIRGPLLIWDEVGGIAIEALSALDPGKVEELRLAEPAPEQMASRMANELAVSLGAMRSATSGYEERRYGPGKLEPVADSLWRASAGYLDVLAALG